MNPLKVGDRVRRKEKDADGILKRIESDGAVNAVGFVDYGGGLVPIPMADLRFVPRHLSEDEAAALDAGV